MSDANVLRIRTTGLNITRGHRDLSERVFVRFPGLVRALNLLRLRLPIRSRLRLFLLLRLAAMALAAINRRDFDLLDIAFDPEFEFIAAGDLYPRTWSDAITATLHIAITGQGWTRPSTA